MSRECRRQACGKEYRVDFLVPDKLWERIKPPSKSTGAGLLCGGCIVDKIEALNKFDAFELSHYCSAIS